MIGSKIQGFEIRERLGSGGMGVVYSAWDPELRRMVAIKALPETARGDPSLWKRLKREAEAAAALTHPSVCQIYRFLADADPPALVLELVTGPSLTARIAEGPLDIDEVVVLVRRISEGLAEAHSKRLIHRDIKPANILLTEDGRPKITDFGLAILPEATRLTLVPSPMGTVPYMSPEQIKGEDPIPQMDTWSLGVVLYEMLTGKRPFKGAVPEVIFNEIRHNDPPTVTDLRPEVSDPIAAVVQRCLDRDLDSRYPDGGVLAEDLNAIEHSLVSGSLADSRLPHTRHRRNYRRWFFLALAMVVLAGSIALSLTIFTGGAVPEFEVKRITENTWWEGEPSISPDGMRVAYAASPDGNLDLFICSAEGGRPFRLTEHPADDSAPAWLPDSQHLLFVSTRTGAPCIWKIGQYGGDAMLIAEGAADPAVSPDGEWLACSVETDGGEMRIAVAPLDEPDKMRVITSSEHGLVAQVSPAWSPDGRRICYSAYDGLWIVDRTGVNPHRLESGSDYHADPVWSASGQHIYFNSLEGQADRISRVPVEGGSVEQVTIGTGPERHPSLSAEGDRLVYSTQRNDSDLVIRNLATGIDARISGVSADIMPTLNHDGTQLVFITDRWGGTSDMFVQELRSGRPVGEPRMILDGKLRCSMPEFSPDSEAIVYYVIDGESRHLEMVRMAGGRPIRLTDGQVNDQQPHWSPDGSEVVFVSDRGGAPGLWRIEVGESGPERDQVQFDTDGMAVWTPRWSPSGKWLAGLVSLDGMLDVWRFSLDGSRKEKITDSGYVIRIRWGDDDSQLWAVGYWGASRAEVRSIDVESGEINVLDPPIQFVSTNTDPSIDYGAQSGLIVYTDVASSGDLWMLQVTRGSF